MNHKIKAFTKSNFCRILLSLFYLKTKIKSTQFTYKENKETWLQGEFRTNYMTIIIFLTNGRFNATNGAIKLFYEIFMLPKLHLEAQYSKKSIIY